MAKIITLLAGVDKLVVRPTKVRRLLIGLVHVVTLSEDRELGGALYKDLIERLLHGLRDSYNNKEIHKFSIFAVSNPHGAMFLKDKGDHDQLDFVGPDAPRVFHSMILSRMEKQQWIDILQKELQG